MAPAYHPRRIRGSTWDAVLRGMIGSAVSTQPMAHPDPEDLVRVAQEKLGRKRSERVYEHCRECQPCADALLELVSEHARTSERSLFTVWNWISLAVLVAIVLGAVGFLSWVSRRAVESASGL